MAESAITVRFIIEMLGAPKEYIESTLAKYLEKLENEGLKIKKKHVAEAEAQGELFSCFAEVVAVFPTVDKLITFAFESMPSSIEILEPDVLTFKAFDFSNSLNDIQVRLHEIEMQVKRLRSTNELLDRNSLELIRNFITHVVNGKPMTPEQIAPIIGVDPIEIKAFLDKMVEENRLTVKEGKYEAQIAK